MPNEKNDYSTTKWKEVVNIKENKKGAWTHVQYEKKWYRIKGSIHTHPHASIHPDKIGMRLPSDEDDALVRSKFPSLPNFVMSRWETWKYTGYKGGIKKVGLTNQVLSGKIKLNPF